MQLPSSMVLPENIKSASDFRESLALLIVLHVAETAIPLPGGFPL